MENKNLVVAILLSAGFLFFWSSFVVPRYMPPPAPPAPAAPAAAPGKPQAAPVIVPAHPVSPLPASVLAAITLRDLQNEIRFSSQGGGVEHWRLYSKGHEV